MKRKMMMRKMIVSIYLRRFYDERRDVELFRRRPTSCCSPTVSDLRRVYLPPTTTPDGICFDDSRLLVLHCFVYDDGKSIGVVCRASFYALLDVVTCFFYVKAICSFYAWVICSFYAQVIGFSSSSILDTVKIFCVSPEFCSSGFLCTESGFVDACAEICSDDGCFFYVPRIYGDDLATFSYRDVKEKNHVDPPWTFSHLSSSSDHHRCRNHYCCCLCCRDRPT